ncbi:transposase [Desulfitobacterium hafniense]|uniref:Transposase n=1 Tax=Desulfitobacterium hafniense TaxID=49338 RepID=A0A0W1JJU7_DESHA|nr:Rpn family recombination-promoting nuclease/putative transposase [Desulfitobacterium hafniense]KTE92004.1 transposase [Desulfitobacterium hafniense]
MDWNLNRINDYLFKWVFGRPENKEILLSFLNSVMSPEGQDELADIALAERELDPEHINDKLSRLDILGKGNDGSIINIEVQIANQYDIDKRTLFYWAKLYQGQLQKGQRYKDLSRTITVNVLNFEFLPDSQRYHSMFSLYEAHTGYRLNRDLEIHFLELSKWKALSIKPKTRLDKWLMYLSNANPQEMEEIAMNEPAIRKALTAEEIFLKQDNERYLYEMREKALLDHISNIEGAKEEGMAEGIAKGRVEGRAEGRAEANKEIALKMLELGMSLSDIVKATGLSEDEIQKLH